MIDASTLFAERPETFELRALEVYRYQYEQVAVYRRWCEGLRIDPVQICRLEQIPFLPISLFKKHIISTHTENELVFQSSGTTGSEPSMHYVRDKSLYDMSIDHAFPLFFPTHEKYVILGLLPSYLERQNSSLVYMVQHWIDHHGEEGSGFYLYDHEGLAARIQEATQHGHKIILIGVTYALLDFIALYSCDSADLTIIETGGMKGNRPEMSKELLHAQLRRAFPHASIGSEYGMTELLSQSFFFNTRAQTSMRFRAVPWKRILIREINDPLAVHSSYTRWGGINIIDLANLNSCAFIATDDLGQLYSDGTFEVLGRLQHSELRGCNLLYS